MKFLFDEEVSDLVENNFRKFPNGSFPEETLGPPAVDLSIKLSLSDFFSRRITSYG